MSEKEGWIHIVSEGKNMIASPTYVRQKILGICQLADRVRVLEERALNLEDKIYELEAPKRQHQILELLKQDGGKRTEGWIQRRVPPYSKSKYWDLDVLVKQGKVLKGSERQPLYSLFEAQKEG